MLAPAPHVRGRQRGRNDIGGSRHTPSRDACRGLWSAVLEQAIRDAFAPRVASHACSGFPTKLDRNQALALLFDSDGPWARQRALLCDLAGIDPGALVERVKRRLGPGP